MGRFREEQVDVDGRSTAVLTAGDGEPLVLFHGGGIVEGFDCFLPLAERFRLIVPFHPGFDGTAGEPPVEGIQSLLRHYAGLFDLLGVDSMVLAGHSLGGWIAASFALDHPGRVRRLVLASPFGLDVPEHPLANIFALAPEDVYGVLTRDPAVFEGKLSLPLDEAFLAARAREGQALGHLVPGPFDPTLAPRLSELQVPTLLVWGDDDQVVPVGHAPVWEAALPNVQARVFAGRGHLLFHEDPEAVDAVLKFASG
jgi:pimeloyl-ACP methyl ester carboxylesterase